MTIRKAIVEDVAEIRCVYTKAKEYMDASGNPNQWQVGYPPQALLDDDIEKGQLYVLEENGIRGVFAFIPGIDPTYLKIDGAWLNDAPYAAIHRIASDGEVRGVFGAIVAYCKEHVESGVDLKVDTHHDNRTMQHVIEKQGFQKCGVIYLENGAPRIAYQLVLH